MQSRSIWMSRFVLVLHFSRLSEWNVTQFQISDDDALPRNICSACNTILKQFEDLYVLSIENEKKLQKLSENSREEAKQLEDDLADAVNEIGLMLDRDGNNLRSNFVDNQDDDSDKSLEIPGSLETDLAKDIDRWD